jgi:hypothetical protein
MELRRGVKILKSTEINLTIGKLSKGFIYIYIYMKISGTKKRNTTVM